jgi:hypothetical protein
MSLRALLRVDVDPPQLVEDRVIVASSDNLSEIEIRFSSASLETPILAIVLYGGEITCTERVTRSHHKFRPSAARPLHAGEHHKYGGRYTNVPRVGYGAVLRTDTAAVVRAVHREGAVRRGRAQADLAHQRHPAAGHRRVRTIRRPARTRSTREVAFEFSQLQQGLSYGIPWSPDAETIDYQPVTESH